MLNDLMQCEITASTFIQMIIQYKWLYVLLYRHYFAICRVIAYRATNKFVFFCIKSALHISSIYEEYF